MNFKETTLGNVIDKTFAILEQIVISSPVPMLPTQLAEKLDLNRATCSRLLKQLMDMGYILKVSRQQGYIAGPKLLTMNNIANFQQEFLNHAVPVIDRCAEDLQTSVLTAQLYHGKRYVLYHKNCSRELDIRITQPCYDDVFETATGLLLLANSSAEERLAYFRSEKKTGKAFLSGFENEKTLNRNLDEVKGAGFLVCEKEFQWIYAYPILRDGVFFAALGASITKEQYTTVYHKRICKTMKAASEEISRKLTTKYTIG